MPPCLIEDLARTLDALEVPLDQDTLAGSAEVMTLLDVLTLVPDPRRRQGCRYSFTGLLSVTAAAVMCDAHSLAAIVRWARGATPALLSALGLADGAACRVPAATTFGRTLTRINGDALDDALTAFTEAHVTDPLDDVVDSGVKSLAADGKTVCGAIDAEGKQLHLLSVFRPETGPSTSTGRSSVPRSAGGSGSNGGVMARSELPKRDGSEIFTVQQYLEQLGWSKRGFARRVHTRCMAVGLQNTVSPSTVARWCSNETVPSIALAAAACYVLSSAIGSPVTPESFGWPVDTADVAAESLDYKDRAHAVKMLTKLWVLDSTKHRNFAKTTQIGFGSASREALSMPPDLTISNRGSRSVTSADIDLLKEQTKLYTKLEAQHGGGKFRSVFAAFLDTHVAPLLSGSFSAKLGRQLYGCVADAAMAIAFMAYDDGLSGLAQRYALQGMRLAQAIGDRSRIARAHIHQARLAAERGCRRDVITYARTAVLLSNGAPPMVKSYAAIAEARAWAFNANPDQTLDAVARARAAFDRAGSFEPKPDWISWFDRYELEGQAAWAFAVVGLDEPGVQALKGAKGKPAYLTRDNIELAIIGAELARLRGDVLEHTRLATHAAENVRHVMSRRLLSHVERLTAGQPLDDF